MKVLFIGLGSIGQRHLRNLLTLGDFDILALRKREIPLPEEFSNINILTYSDLDLALGQKPDFAILGAPPKVQQETLLKIAKAGCHFFVEKPIAASWEGMEETLEQVQLRQLTTMVGYNLRHHPVHKRLQEYLAVCKIGKIVSARVSVGQWLPDWHPHDDYRLGYSARQDLGGGVILDLIHEIDFICSLFGGISEVKSMFGKNSSLDISTEDTAEILLRFESGIIGSIHLDYVQRHPYRNGMIVGEEGTILYDLLKNEITVLLTNHVKEQVIFTQSNRNDMYLEELKDFVNAVKFGKMCSPDFEMGLQVLKIALAAKKT